MRHPRSIQIQPVVALLTLGLVHPASADGVFSRNRDLKELIGLLQRPEEEVRGSAARHLARLGSAAAPARAALDKLLREYGADGSGIAAVQAFRAMGKAGLPSLLSALAIPDENGSFEKATTMAVAAIGNLALAPLAALATAGQTALVRQRAIAAIGQIEGGAAAARPALERALADGEAAVRQSAIETLAATGPSAVPALIRALGDRAEPIRATAARALAAIGARAAGAVQPLRRMLAAGGGAESRSAAAEALGQIAPLATEVRRGLETALRDRDGTVRAAAALSLGSSGASALPSLLRAFADSDDAVRTAIVRAVSEIGLSTPPVLRLLRRSGADRSEKVRCETIDAIVSVDKPGAAARLALLAALRDLDDSVQQTAAAKLANWSGSGSAVVFEAVRRALGRRDLDNEARGLLTAALGRVAPRAALALPLLRRALRNETDPRAAAASALGELGAVAAPAVPELGAILSTEDSDELVAAAVRALGQIGPRAVSAVPRIERLLSRSEVELRREAAVALAAIGRGASSARGTLERIALEDSALEARCASTLALGAIGGSSSIPLLLRLLGEQHFELRTAAAYALGEMRVASALPGLEAGLRKERIRVSTAVQALATIGGRGVAALGRVLSHPLADARRSAATALGRIGAAARAELPALQRAAADHDPEVRRAVIEAINAINAISGLTAARENLAASR